MLEIRKFEIEDGPTVVAMIDTLLDELGPEREGCPMLDGERLLGIWRDLADTYFVFGAEQDGACVGVVTVVVMPKISNGNVLREPDVRSGRDAGSKRVERSDTAAHEGTTGSVP